jgi:tetratricopeptide (TPR) repeat protein
MLRNRAGRTTVLPEIGVLLCVLSLCLLVGPIETVEAQTQPSRSGRAVQLFKNRQYNDAVQVLLSEVKGQPDEKVARQNLLIGECYYQTKRYGDARPYFVKAVRHLGDGSNKRIAEQRLVAAAYRLKDFEGANDRIDAFLSKYPEDRRGGSLLNYKMLILSSKGQDSLPQLRQLHKRIQDNVKRYGYTTSMEADRILCDFYRRIGQSEEARELYARIVHNFRRVISERQSSGQPIPVAFEKAHDNAALQLGVIFLDEKKTSEAVKWLENVRYDLEMKQKARLMLAKSAYERRDFKKAISYLTSGDFLDTVPAGRTKSDMHLLLGLAENNREAPNASRVEQYLRQVGPESSGFQQAQAAIAGIYHRKGLLEEAAAAYGHVLESPDHAPHALFALGEIFLTQAAAATQAAQQQALYRKSSDMLNQLYVKYPLSPVTKRAAVHIETLKSKGIDVSFALGQDEKLQTWQKTVARQPGTEQAVRALMSLMRTYSKAVVDTQTGRVVQPPDHIGCAKFCDQLLDENAYSGKGFTEESWRAIRAEANYLRGQCEIASVKSSDRTQSAETPLRVLPNADPERAIASFQAAQSLVDPKSLELLKSIELGLVEAMFKSASEETQQAAEKRFAELEADYGTDKRFQQLALELAQWYRDQGRFAAAAHQYAGVADRSQDLDEDQVMDLLYAAGQLYSRAAYESLQDPTANTYALYIYPQEVIRLGGLLKTHRRLQQTIEWKLPTGARFALGREALQIISKASGIPFVWRPDRDNKSSFDMYLDGKLVDLPAGQYTVRELLEEILDLERHELELDIGLSGGTPTLDPRPGDLENPDDSNRQVIEFYDRSLAHLRLQPLNRDFGSYKAVYGEGFSATLYRILNRIQEQTECRILWADGIDKQEMLAAEYQSFPDVKKLSANVTCAQALTSVLQPRELRFRIVQRKIADDLYLAGFQQFNKIRQINPRHKFGERSLFALAINFSQQRDYPKMKIVLREYLKLFDSPSYEHYRAACFWVGWAFENEKNYRDAVQYYSRAAEERLVVYKLADDEQAPTKTELSQQLSYDAQFALAEQISGEFNATTLSEFVDFLQLNARVDIRLDPSAQAIESHIDRAAFKSVPAWDVFVEGLGQVGASIRVENAEPKVAERAYYRMAACYQQDNLMQQALEHCRTLLTRYPETNRRPDAYRLMIDIYKGLRDYGKVLTTLDDYKASAGDSIEKYQLDFEIGRIYFDMADYEKAAESFRQALAATRVQGDRAAIRDGYAKALYRLGDLENALIQFETLVKNENDPLRIFVAEQMAFLIGFSLEKTLEREYPEDHVRYIQGYEQLPEDARQKLSRSQFAKATWIYYVLANIDAKKNRLDAARVKLNAVTSSPDEFLAATAAYELGLLYMQARDFKSAREVFEHLLFALNSPESAVRATYALGICLEKLGKPKQAARRYRQLVERYPVSPYAEKVKGNPLYQQGNSPPRADDAPVESEEAETAEVE